MRIDLGVQLMRVAVVKDGVVVNTVEVAEGWPDKVAPTDRWEPPAGHEAVELHPTSPVGKGWLRTGKGFAVSPEILAQRPADSPSQLVDDQPGATVNRIDPGPAEAEPPSGGHPV